ALKLVSIRIPAPPGLVVALGRSSGRLVIEADEPWEPGRPHLAIGHAGARELLIGLIAFWARPNKATWDARRIAVPAIEPGEYELCATTIAGGTMSPEDETCSRGTLSSDGELVLRLPRPR